MKAARSLRRARSAAYTAVEVLMSLTVLTIGAMGVMAMQRAAVQGNVDAREMDQAQAIARLWLDRLSRDATLWTPSQIPSVPPANLSSALLVNENLTGQWFVPKARMTTSGQQFDEESAGFDILGRDMTSLATGNGLRYCVNLRLTPATSDQTLIRAEVRVFWPRNLTAAPDPKYCEQTPPAALDTQTDVYHFVYAVGAVRQNVQP